MLEFDKIIHLPTPIVELHDDLFIKKGIRLYVKRDDMTHEMISGNKFRKLKYNLIEAKKQNKQRIVTFGGAFSNHIYAVAAAAKLFGFSALGIIRGDELNEESSLTLRKSAELGMKFKFISRNEYRNKSISDYLSTDYLVPEGGTNEFALKGLSEMMDEINSQGQLDEICVAMGTGGTLAGMLTNENFKGNLNGFPVLKNGSFLRDDMAHLIGNDLTQKAHMFIDYHFGGYGKYNQELLDFMHKQEHKHKFRLDQVYTAKLFYGVYDLIQKDYFESGKSILIIHTGGIQGRINA